MKPLENLNNVERAKLLHGLFPAEIPALLKYITGMSQTIAEEQEQIKATWQHPLIAVNLWLSLAAEAERKISQYGDKLKKSSSLFADQLFDGYAAVYLVHCLIQYTTERKLNNQKFSKAVNLLFMD
ncbi:hypothetical protein BDD43_0801 [Mucilaginibacter gracilis]|uniref:Uncharacterized protein n=1 Tax=Mucilaginibacter gracilis TaxID=423350 RepID=A0A495IXR8_9SPHI|nr:hypothetical protein [Mucilaginibacter gracilis]RKR80669.1 hypothetical protein BDD43_0801 [Mucilaginibacter gracilis]